MTHEGHAIIAAWVTINRYVDKKHLTLLSIDRHTAPVG
jgi:hypothetical protein